MKRNVLIVTILTVFTMIICFPAMAYEKSDRQIQQVLFSVIGSVSSDMSNIHLTVKTPVRDKYYYTGHEIIGINDGIADVKLSFHAVNQYYFRITKASQITIHNPEMIKYVSAAREENGYQLIVEVKFPTDTELNASELPQVSSVKTQTGWEQSNGFWYYRLSDGSLVKGWKQIDGEWYYFYFDGRMASNEWLADEYYVDGSGKMLHDTVTPDGYRVGSDGKWIRETQGPTQNNSEAYTRSSSRTGLYYWTENGGSYHLTPDCPTLKKSKNIYSGDSIPSGNTDPCNICAR